MSRCFVKRGAVMLCMLVGLAVLFFRRGATGAGSASPNTSAKVAHESAADSQTRSSGSTVYVGPRTFSPVYEYCYVDADGKPVMIHRRRLVFFLPESRPDVNDRTFIETDTCQ